MFLQIHGFSVVCCVNLSYLLENLCGSTSVGLALSFLFYTNYNEEITFFETSRVQVIDSIFVSDTI